MMSTHNYCTHICRMHITRLAGQSVLIVAHYFVHHYVKESNYYYYYLQIIQSF